MWFWNLFFKVEDSGQSHWNKCRHSRGYCEMHIFTAQYYHRLGGLLLSAFPIISAWLLIADAHTSDQEAADKEAWSLHQSESPFTCSLATRCDAGQLHLHACFCPLKCVGRKGVCTLVAGMQDIALLRKTNIMNVILSGRNAKCGCTEGE